MKRRLASAIVVSVFCIALCSEAYAQVKENFELNIFGGGSFYTTKKYEIGPPQSPTPVPGEFKLGHAIKGGLRVGVYTRGHWSEEFFYSYEPTTAHFIRRGSAPRSTDLRMGVHNYGITALYYLSENESNTVRPFLSIGLGGTVYRLTPEAQAIARDPLRGNLPDMDNSHELTLNYGVGLKTRSSGWLGVRVDVRGFLGRTPAFGLARKSNDPNATVFPATGPIQNLETSAGLVFYFSKKR